MSALSQSGRVLSQKTTLENIKNIPHAEQVSTIRFREVFSNETGEKIIGKKRKAENFRLTVKDDYSKDQVF